MKALVDAQPQVCAAFQSLLSVRSLAATWVAEGGERVVVGRVGAKDLAHRP